ncbi:MAG: PAS domain S-box protein [Bacteroidetes bacterium]|nr:PAS domain S-box protein [Bacteroidota bacterium]
MLHAPMRGLPAVLTVIVGIILGAVALVGSSSAALLVGLAVVLVGAGLSGTYAAWQKRQQHDHLEKRLRALRESEDRYRCLVEQSPDPIVVHQEGKIVYISPAGLDMIGAEAASDVVGRSIMTFVHDDYKDQVRQRIQQLYASAQHADLIEEKLIRLDGTPIDVEATGMPVTYDGAPAVQVMLRDITERKRAERALQESEDKFSRAFRAAPVAISISTLDDGRFMDVNTRFAELLGYDDPQEIIGQTSEDIGMWVESGDRERMLKIVREQNLRAHHWEGHVRTRQGEVRDVIVSVEVAEFDGAPCLLGMLVDVTERKRAEQRVDALRTFYENALDALPIQVAVLDPHGRFLYLNPAAMPDPDLRAQLFGKTSEAIPELCDFDPAPYRARHNWLMTVARDKEVKTLEETLTTRTGETRHMLRVARPVLDEQGEVLYLVGYGMDVTERTEYEHHLKEAKEQAEDLARLKSAFLANMSHEIRTPLTGIIGFASVLDDEVSEEHREIVTLIRHSGERLMETLNSVLDLARLEAGALDIEPTLLNLIEEVTETARLFQSMSDEKDLPLRIETPRQPVHALLDRAALHRVLSNLLSNAIKFTESGHVALTLTVEDDDAVITVEDTGIGISDDFMPHLFDEFKQESTGLARSHTGSGLGLAITRRLVEQMGGAIEVESTKGEGTCFILRFSRAIPDAASPSNGQVATSTAHP